MKLTIELSDAETQFLEDLFRGLESEAVHRDHVPVVWRTDARSLVMGLAPRIIKMIVEGRRK